MRGCTARLAWLRTPQARLLFLAPALSQMLIGAKSPGEFLHPQNLFVALVVYGCGALVVHDLARRWSDGVEGTFWPRLLWLAAAYGVLVDGVMLGSYTSLDWSRLGRLADTNHGHLLGLNLTWSVMALAHHVALAVVVPIALIELMDPDAGGRAWLGPKGLRRCNRLFYAAVVFGALAQQQRGSKAAYAFVCLLAVLLWRKARWWRPRPARSSASCASSWARCCC
ncbi:MAG: hypothetical protein HZB16_15985 [Armatimonadetes bacterium]|nr:hypothetical protein [Armatimonadota bacterium]